mgnify:CR=1 FL=1
MGKHLAMITGGTSGLGLGAAKKLCETHDLALTYACDHEKADRAKREFETMDVHVKTFPKPMHTYQDAKELVEQVEEEFGRSPDILVNSAGCIRDGLFMSTDFTQHEKVVCEHLIISMALCHLTVESMYRNKFGRIVNLSSISAVYAKRGQTAYAAAKAGIIGFTKTLALEVAHRGVTVNALAPGLIDTPMTSAIVARLNQMPIKETRKRIPAGFVGEPEDVASLISFLCSHEARYITGALITIDGGRSLGDCS